MLSITAGARRQALANSALLWQKGIEESIVDGHLVGQGHGKGTTEGKVLAGEQLGFTPRRGVQTVFSRCRDSIGKKAPFLTLRQRHPTLIPISLTVSCGSHPLVFNHLVSQSIRRDRVLWCPLFPG